MMATAEIQVTFKPSPELADIIARANKGEQIHPSTVLLAMEVAGKQTRFTFGDLLEAVNRRMSVNVRIEQTIEDGSDPNAVYLATRRAVFDALHRDE